MKILAITGQDYYQRPTGYIVEMGATELELLTDKPSLRSGTEIEFSDLYSNLVNLRRNKDKLKKIKGEIIAFANLLDFVEPSVTELITEQPVEKTDD